MKLCANIGILPENTKGIVCVVENNLDQVFTYQINGKDAEFMGMEDLHDSQYDDEVVTASFSFDDDKNMYSGAPLDETTIKYQIRIYPSSEFEEDYKNPLAIIFTSVMLFIFLLTILVFVAYDRVVQKRQDVVMAAAERSGAVLASLFPKAVRARLLDEAQPIVKPAPGKSRLKKYLHEGDENTVGAFQSKPIADLFPDVTVIMCDLVGFTAWSSTREPEQVFTLLETMYQAFDVIAKKRGVFKIETVGDCYGKFMYCCIVCNRCCYSSTPCLTYCISKLQLRSVVCPIQINNTQSLWPNSPANALLR